MANEQLKIRTAPWALPEIQRDPNYINIHVEADRSAAILTVHVNGQDEGWITYDIPQLDELIRMLQAARDDLLP